MCPLRLCQEAPSCSVQGQKPTPPVALAALPLVVFLSQNLDGTNHRCPVFGYGATVTARDFCRDADDRLSGFDQAREFASILESYVSAHT